MSGAGSRRPLVSVIIPAFNAQATLREAASSALASTYGDLELIIVDDGSTDATRELADELGRADPRVRVVTRANGGLSAALNSGFAAAQGDYIARLDADDLWHPAKLERQIELALGDPELAFIFTWVRYVDEDGCVVRDGPRQSFPRRALCRGLYESIVGGGSSALMKRSAVIAAGGCDERLRSWEDLLLQLKISARHPVGCVPEHLVGYRVRPGSLSQDPAQMLRTWRTVREEVKALFPVIPAAVHAWAHCRRCALFSEALAWRGRYLACAGLLAEALRSDPEWTSKFLAYRLRRPLGRGECAAQRQEPGPHFFDCDPREQVRPSAYDRGVEGVGLRKLEEKRARWLADVDAALAQTPR